MIKERIEQLGQTELLQPDVRAVQGLEQCLKERKMTDLELSGKLDNMQYSGISCQTTLIMLFNQIVDFCFSEKEKTVDLNFFLGKAFDMVQQWGCIT